MSTKIHKHYLQSQEWADLRKYAGWGVHTIETDTLLEHIYLKKTPLGAIMYMPGSDATTSSAVAGLTRNLKASKNGAIVCKLEPCIPQNSSLANAFLQHGWRRSRNVQYEFTVRLDLVKSEDLLLAEMKKRARWEIRTAIKKGVHTYEAEATKENFELMHGLLSSTSKRKDFSVRDKEFVLKFWERFSEANKLRLFFAQHDDDVLAGAVIILNDDGSIAWYKDGASVAFKMDLYAPRLLIWEVARVLKVQGVEVFDLGGVPNPDGYEQSHMKGIYIFKTAYSHEITTMAPAYELPLKKFSYLLWPKIETMYKTFKNLGKKVR